MKKVMRLDNKEILHCALEDIWNQGKQELIEQYYHRDFVAHIYGTSETMSGTQGVRDVLTEFKSAFPDFHEDCHDLICEGDRIAARITISGTQVKAYRGHPSNGGHFEITSMDIYRFAESKIIEQWGIIDMTTMVTELGWEYLSL